MYVYFPIVLIAECPVGTGFFLFCVYILPTVVLTQVRAKTIVPNKKVDIGMEVHYLCQPNTYMSLLVNLVSSSDGNDIGVGLT